MFNTHNVGMTHIDALVHIPVDGKVYPGIPHTEAVAAGTVKRSSTTAFADGIVTRGVLLDLAPGGRLSPGHPITADDFESAEKRVGVHVESGDALVVRGGWVVFTDFKDGLPGMTLDAVRWMAERGVSLYCGDVGDRPPTGPGQSMPLHQVALAQLGLPLIDGADVSTLASTCAELQRWTFLFALGAIPVHGATGVPVNPLAIF
jgi:kynurenine formamidase